MHPIKAVKPNIASPGGENESTGSPHEFARMPQADEIGRQQSASLSDRDDRDITLLEYWQVIYKRKAAISGFCTAVVAATLAWSLTQPKIFESNATLLPQLESNPGLGLSSLLASSGSSSAVQTMGISLPGAPATPTDVFIAILKSRIMADDAIRRFGLMERYEKKLMQDARAALEGATRIAVTKEKAIKITVEDKDPQLAADIANFYASNLDRLNQTLSVSKARENRKFIEQRLAETQAELVKVENSLKEFQTQNRTVGIEAQSKAMIEAAATIEAQIMAQEVQLQVMGTYLSQDNPEIARVQSSINELRKQLRVMQSGKEGKERVSGDRLNPPITSVPALALKYGRLARDLKVQETLYALLISEYEQAKLAEARDTPTVEVLDPAIPAERNSRPRISHNVVLAGILSLFSGVFLALAIAAFQRLKTRFSPQYS